MIKMIIENKSKHAPYMTPNNSNRMTFFRFAYQFLAERAPIIMNLVENFQRETETNQTSTKKDQQFELNFEFAEKLSVCARKS